MVNVEKFIKRLQMILDYYSLTASSFADKINVQRSSLSHLLSGRNKPSLEFIMKIIDEFPEVTLEWIVYGNGNFPKEEIVFQKQVKIEKPIIESTKVENSNDAVRNADLFSDSVSEEAKNSNPVEEVIFNSPTTPSKDSAIEQIVIFYRNGTFKNYNS